MAEKKTVKVVAVRAFLHEGKRVNPGSVIEVSEGCAADIFSTGRGVEATEENVKANAPAKK